MSSDFIGQLDNTKKGECYSSHLSPLTLVVIGAPQMMLQQYLFTFPCLPLPSENLQTSSEPVFYPAIEQNCTLGLVIQIFNDSYDVGVITCILSYSHRRILALY